MKTPAFKSTYAILDVTTGRAALQRHLLKNGPVEVVITATISEPYGKDDGISIEFNCDVTSLEIKGAA
jgi:hypothetical protein